MRGALPLFFARTRQFFFDARGATTILMAGSMTAIIGAAAVAVDVGSIYYVKRKAQTAVDLAAIAGAGSLPNYDAIVKNSLADNGFSFMREPVAGGAAGGGAALGSDSLSTAALTMIPGRYAPDVATPIAQRFVPSSAQTANALRVTMRRTTPIYFGKLFTGQPDVSYEVSSTAATATSAAFSVGTRLLKLDGGIANALLSGLLGTSVSLSVMDYEALATAKIEMFPFLDALGKELNIQVVSYDSLLNISGPIGKVLAAASSVARTTNQSAAADALRRLANVTDVARLNVKLRDIIDLGPLGEKTVGEGPAVAAQFDALNLLMANAQLVNAKRQIQLDLALNLPGLASAKLTLGIGERPVKSVWLANGRPNSAEVHTAQTRLLLDVKILGNAVVPAGVRLPLYVELAAADARLADVRCRLNVADTRVEIDARPGVVDAWIGDVGMAEFNNMTSPVNPPAAALVSLLGVKVTGRAHATLSNIAYDRLSFTVDDIRNRRAQTVRTRDFTTSLVSKLVGDLELKTQVLGIPLIDLSLLTKAVGGLTKNVTPSIDALLFSTLNLLGVGLGEADVWANGVRCDGGVLVN